MKSRLPLALALTGLIGAGVLTTAQFAIAEQSADAPKANTEEDFKPSPADRAAFLDARIAALHAGLGLNADQEKLWPPVESALRDLAKTLAGQFQQMHEQRHEHKFWTDPVGRLKQMSDNQIARGEALKKVADAAAPLYSSLNDEQKHRLPILLRAIRPHFMHHWAGHEGRERMMEHGMMEPNMMEHGGWEHRHMDHEMEPDEE